MKYFKLLPAVLASSLLLAIPVSAADTPQGASIGSVLDDTALIAKVKSILAADVGLKTLMLDIDSKNGDVIVTGKVKSEEVKNKVTAAVKAIEGVKSVNNFVAVVAE